MLLCSTVKLQGFFAQQDNECLTEAVHLSMFKKEKQKKLLLHKATNTAYIICKKPPER